MREQDYMRKKEVQWGREGIYLRFDRVVAKRSHSIVNAQERCALCFLHGWLQNEMQLTFAGLAGFTAIITYLLAVVDDVLTDLPEQKGTGQFLRRLAQFWKIEVDRPFGAVDLAEKCQEFLAIHSDFRIEGFTVVLRVFAGTD
jgi:hypothetical protein